MKPIRVKRGSVSVAVYCVPFRGKKRYEVRYRYEGRLHRPKFTSKSAALLLAGEMATCIANGWGAIARLIHMGEKGAALAGKLEQAMEILEPDGKDVLQLAYEYRERKLAATRVQASQALTLKELLERFLAAKKSDGVGAYHLRDLAGRLGRAAKDLALPFAHLDAPTLTAWLDGLGVGVRTRSNYRNALAALAHWGREMQLLPADFNPFKTIAGRAVDAPRPEVLTPRDLERLLERAPEGLQRCLAISAFAGIRTEEVQKLRWEDFLWEAGEIHLRREIVKGRTGRRKARAVPICDALAEWLIDYRHTKGPVSPYANAKSQSGMRYAALKRLNRDVDAREGNILRKSWISYQLAQSADIGKVATWAGNSPKMIQENYLNLVTAESASEWFEIRPKNVTQQILRLKF